MREESGDSSASIHLDEHDKRQLKHRFGRHLGKDTDFEVFVSKIESAMKQFAKRYNRIPDHLERKKQVKELCERHDRIMEGVQAVKGLHFRGDKRLKLHVAVQHGKKWSDGGQELMSIGAARLTEYVALGEIMAAAAKAAAERSEMAKDRKDGYRELTAFARSVLEIFESLCHTSAVTDGEICFLLKWACKKVGAAKAYSDQSYRRALRKARKPADPQREASDDAED